MWYRQIGLGTKLELEIGDEDKEKLILVSQYETYDEKINLMEILVPFHEGRIYPIHPGTIMRVFFSKGKDTFAFEAEAINREVQNNIAILRITPVTQIKKIERRAFFRMNYELEVRYRILDALSDEEAGEEGVFLKGQTRDISGGGFCILTGWEFEIGTRIEAFLKIETEVHCIGAVVRSKKIREKGKILYDTGIEFKTIENRDRERIISFIFETQRERLKKGWMRRDEEL
ncbi:MAG: flagellar brake protein [Clostridiaceae bacterium]|nr:flagellar brake protein [Clostridiaceae bacterium]